MTNYPTVALTKEDERAFHVAIGYKVAAMMNLKPDATGKVKTQYNNCTIMKSIEGLGAAVYEIVLAESQRLTE